MYIVRTTKELRTISGLLFDNAMDLRKKAQNTSDPLSDGYLMLSQERGETADRMLLVLREMERAEAIEKRALAGLADPKIDILTKVDS